MLECKFKPAPASERFDNPNDMVAQHGERFCGAIPEGSMNYPNHCLHGPSTGDQACCWCGDVFTGPNVDTDEHGDNYHPLTRREVQVTQLLADGLSNKQIGERLGLSDHTAKFHVTNILRKLEQGTRAAAVAVAVRRGIV